MTAPAIPAGSLRQVEVRRVAEAPAPGAVPDLRWVPISEIVIDDRYQRPLGAGNWKAIRKIAANFDWARFTPVLLAPAGSAFALIDGQHRTHAAAAIGHDAVPAMIVDADMTRQADAFTWINGQVTAMTVFHVLKAGLAAGLDWAVEMRAVVDAAGCRLMTYPAAKSNRRARDVYSVGLIRRHVEAGRGDWVVTRGLSALVAAGCDGPEFMADAVLQPWLGQLQDWPALTVPDLTGFLSAHDLQAMSGKAARLREDPKYRHESHRAMLEMLLTRAFFRQFRKAS